MTASSPLFLAAFQRLLHSAKLKRSLDILEKKFDIIKELDELNKLEEEMVRLRRGEVEGSKVGNQRGGDLKIEWVAIETRMRDVNAKMIAIGKRLEKKEKELRDLENS